MGKRHSPSSPWKEVPRRGGGWNRRGMKGNVRSPVLVYCHPERSRGIFYVAAVLCTYEVMIKSPRCFGGSSSDALRLTVVQGRFLALLEMTIWGKAVFSFSACLRRFLLSLSYRQYPIRPFGAPSPRGEGFWCGSGILISLTFPSGSEWRLGVALLHASGAAP